VPISIWNIDIIYFYHFYVISRSNKKLLVLIVINYIGWYLGTYLFLCKNNNTLIIFYFFIQRNNICIGENVVLILGYLLTVLTGSKYIILAVPPGVTRAKVTSGEIVGNIITYVYKLKDSKMH